MSGLGIHDLALFAFTVLVLNATPGVDMLYTVSRTMTCGWRGGLAASLGISAGCVVHALLAAFGLAALLAVSGWAFSLIKWAAMRAGAASRRPRPPRRLRCRPGPSFVRAC